MKNLLNLEEIKALSKIEQKNFWEETKILLA